VLKALLNALYGEDVEDEWRFVDFLHNGHELVVDVLESIRF